MARSESQPGNTWPIFLAVSGYLILRFLAAILLRGGEWPLPPVHYFSMLVDLCLLVGVFGARSQLMAKLANGDSHIRTVDILFIAAIVSGIGLLVIRFTSDAAWWTGYLRN